MRAPSGDQAGDDWTAGWAGRASSAVPSAITV